MRIFISAKAARIFFDRDDVVYLSRLGHPEDAFTDHPISVSKLACNDFKLYGERIGKLKLPTLFVMEGGYAVAEIGINTVNVLDGFQEA